MQLFIASDLTTLYDIFRVPSTRTPAGNPAAVCLLSADISDELKQQIAAEMNLSETAFVTPRERYFT